MTIREGWEIYQLCELTLFIAAIPLVAYRIWRWVANRPSRSLQAGAVFATSLWIWTYFDTEFGWKILAPQLQSFQAAGGTAILASSSLLVFTINACQTAPKRQDNMIYMSAIVTTAVIAVLALTVPDTHASANYYTFLTEPHPNLPSQLHLAIILGHLYIFCASGWIAILGLKNMSWTPAGQGIGMLGIACLLLLVTVFSRYIAGEVYQWHGYGPPFWCGLVIQTIFGATAAIVALVAFAWPPTSLWLKACAESRALRPIHRDLILALPGLAPPLSREDRLTDRIHDYISQIQDGLFLTAQLRGTVLTHRHRDGDVHENSDQVATWLLNPTTGRYEELCLSTPSSLSDKQWILMIAYRYKHKSTHSSVDCDPSDDTPSTSHRRSTISATTRRLSADNA